MAGLCRPYEMRVHPARRCLPQLHKDVLRQHLRRLSFLDLRPGSGSALTGVVEGESPVQTFEIMLHADLLNESLTTFLNTKEARLFEDDGSGNSVLFDAEDRDAPTYVLLHEATHIVDQVLGLSDDHANPLLAGSRVHNRAFAAPYKESPLAQTGFRGAPLIPFGVAPAAYEALRDSPFVSFYATAAAPEDLAELFAWQHLVTELDQSLTLDVVDDNGLAIFAYNPLSTPQMRACFAEVEKVHYRYRTNCNTRAPTDY